MEANSRRVRSSKNQAFFNKTKNLKVNESDSFQIKLYY